MPPTPEGAVDERLAFSPTNAAVVVGMSRATMYRLIKDGRIRTVAVGRRRLIRREDLVAFLDSLPAA